jgi:hypothetical protein
MIKINDAHVHLGPSCPWEPESDPSTTIKDVLKLMKTVGMERCVVFPNPSIGIEYPKKNDYILKATKIYPKLFVPFGRIDPRDKKRSIKEIRRLAEKGFVGIKLHPIVECFRPDHPFFSEIYEEIQKFGMIVLTHTDVKCYRKIPSGKAEYWKSICQKYKGLKIILAHFNEGCMELLENYQNVYVDTSASDFLFTLDLSKIIKLRKKILFGSDYPYVKDIKNNLKKILDTTLPKSVKQDILYNNFNKLFQQ